MDGEKAAAALDLPDDAKEPILRAEIHLGGYEVDIHSSAAGEKAEGVRAELLADLGLYELDIPRNGSEATVS